MTDFKKWFAARARNPTKITLEEAFNAGKRSAQSAVPTSPPPPPPGPPLRVIREGISVSPAMEK